VRTHLVIAAALCTLAASPAYAGNTVHGHGASGLKRCHGLAAGHHSVTPAPVTIGANWTLTTAAGSPAVVAPTLEQVKVAEFEINSSCGLRVGSSKHWKKSKKPIGSPLEVLVRDNRTTAEESAMVTHGLIDDGAVAVVGGGGSVTGPLAAQVAVERSIPFGANQAAADAISGCTAAELLDPAVTKSTTPVYGAGQCWNHRGLAFRTTATGRDWGTVAAAYARATYPASTTAAIAYLDNDFGRPNRDGLRARFAELGGTVVAEGGFDPVTATVAELKTLLQTITAGNPQIILGSNTIPALGNFMQAYVELRDDPTWLAKPANFDTLRFVWGSTLSGDYGGLGAAALAALVSQSVLVQPSWDPNSPAFQSWFEVYRSYNPAAQPPSSGFTMSAYDAMIVMSLAITAAGKTDAQAVAAQLREVANPPGKVVCPGQWKKAFGLLSKGKDINYEGALGPVDLDERGNPTGITYGAYNVQPDGSTTLTGTIGSPVQPRCSR
jgi:ABC-type branched-subunit amino acid transport system substrate-binding protein